MGASDFVGDGIECEFTIIIGNEDGNLRREGPDVVKWVHKGDNDHMEIWLGLKSLCKTPNEAYGHSGGIFHGTVSLKML